MAGEIPGGYQPDVVEDGQTEVTRHSPPQSEWLWNPTLQAVLRERQEEVARIDQEIHGNRGRTKYSTTPND